MINFKVNIDTVAIKSKIYEQLRIDPKTREFRVAVAQNILNELGVNLVEIFVKNVRESKAGFNSDQSLADNEESTRRRKSYKQIANGRVRKLQPLVEVHGSLMDKDMIDIDVTAESGGRQMLRFRLNNTNKQTTFTGRDRQNYTIATPYEKYQYSLKWSETYGKNWDQVNPVNDREFRKYVKDFIMKEYSNLITQIRGLRILS